MLFQSVATVVLLHTYDVHTALVEHQPFDKIICFVDIGKRLGPEMLGTYELLLDVAGVAHCSMPV
ncbi:hypothetical protein BDC45DRAFT_507782 [Circinella umbellata]|nr:hypothetical protein BDC45DRAFT_507782 [Circinella umbellata]